MLPLAASPAVPRASITRYPGALLGVSAVSRSDAWAVGGFSIAGGRRLVLHWNGRAWARVASLSRGVPPDSILTGVSATSPSAALAVGWSYLYGPDEQKSLALRWNGTAWKQVASPNPGPAGDVFAPLYGVSALSPSSAWAVGHGRGVLILHWNGSSWARS